MCNPFRGLDCPGGVWVEAEREGGECGVEGFDGGDFLRWWEDAALEFYCAEAVLGYDFAGLRDESFGG